MIFLPGSLGWAAMRRSQTFFGGNGAAIAGGLTDLTADIDIPAMVAGDLVFISMYFFGTKGATAGDTKLILQQNAGLASLLIGGKAAAPTDLKFAVPISGLDERNVAWILTVNTGGTWNGRLQGTSVGSNETVNAVGIKGLIHVIRGS